MLTRSVRDSAAVLDVTSGGEPGDLFSLPPPSRPYVEEAAIDPVPTVIGLVTESPAGVDPQCRRAVEAAAALLESLGHRIEPVAHRVLFPSVDGDATSLTFRVTSRRAYFSVLEHVLRRPPRVEDVEPYTWFRLGGSDATAEEYAAALEHEQRHAHRLAEWWHDRDRLLLTPTVGMPPPLLADLLPASDDLCSYASFAFAKFACFTSPWNLTGNPAVTLPLASTADRLPIGVQLVAALGREDLLFRVAGQLERAQAFEPGSIAPPHLTHRGRADGTLARVGSRLAGHPHTRQ